MSGRDRWKVCLRLLSNDGGIRVDIADVHHAKHFAYRNIFDLPNVILSPFTCRCADRSGGGPACVERSGDETDIAGIFLLGRQRLGSVHHLELVVLTFRAFDCE